MAMRSGGLYHKTAFRLCFLLALCLSLFSGCSRQAAGGENIFQTAIRFEDGIICPRDCDFAAPFDEVLKAKGLTEEAIDDAREDSKRSPSTACQMKLGKSVVSKTTGWFRSLTISRFPPTISMQSKACFNSRRKPIFRRKCC